MLKVGFPARELITETEALRAYDGRGAVRLLASEPNLGALLLERLRPGRPLSSLPDDDAATRTAAGVMRRLPRPVPAGHPFPCVADWASGLSRLRAGYDGGTGPLPAPLVEAAEGLFADLLASSAAPVLLHGDLHHDNILASGDTWLAIDPKGLVGEPAYEVGTLLRNRLPEPWDGPAARRMLARRLDLLSECLEMEWERLRGWGLAQAVLSAWWSVEDHGGGWEPAIACAELLAALATRSS